MDTGKLSEVIQPPDRTAVPVQYSIQQPDHGKQGFETDTDRPTVPAAVRWLINTVFMAIMSMILTYHSIHGRICACKEEICGTAVTFHTDRMCNGITKTKLF